MQFLITEQFYLYLLDQSHYSNILLCLFDIISERCFNTQKYLSFSSYNSSNLILAIVNFYCLKLYCWVHVYVHVIFTYLFCSFHYFPLSCGILLSILSSTELASLTSFDPYLPSVFLISISFSHSNSFPLNASLIEIILLDHF